MGQNWKLDRMIRLECSPSTNLDLKKLDEIGNVEGGSVLIAETQTAGRGRFDRKFSSPKGGLYYSYLMVIEDFGDELLEITPMVGVAARRAVYRTCYVAADIKWPNDLLVSGKKICGILAESRTVNSSEIHIVIGIGINANTELSDIAEEYRDTADTLKNITGREIDMELLIRCLTDELDRLGEALTKGETEDYLEEYRAICVNPGDEIVKL